MPYWKDVIDYKDRRGAILALKKLGCRQLKDAPDIILGTPKKDISEAKVGDVVYFINERGQGILGICNGVRAYFLCDEGGITARKIEECEFCWSIN